MLESRTLNDEERIQQLEKELEVTILFGEEADRKYEEVGCIAPCSHTNLRLVVAVAALRFICTW